MQEYKKASVWKRILRLIDLQEYRISNVDEKVLFLAYAVIAFFIPLVLKHPQVLLGSFVNMVIVLSALNLKGKNLLPIILLPSVGAFIGGYLFGGLTIYIMYMIPFIWIGNTVLVLAFKYLKLKKKQNFFLTLGIGSALKAGFLFAVTYVFVSIALVPQSFLLMMGAMQLTTALIGGTLAFTVQKIRI